MTYDINNLAKLLHQSFLFRTLPFERIIALASSSDNEIATYVQNELVYEVEGCPLDKIYYVISGTLEKTRQGERLALFQQGTVLGEEELLSTDTDKAFRCYQVHAVKQAEIFKVDKKYVFLALRYFVQTNSQDRVTL